MADAIISFGVWVRRRRRALDMTQDDLAVLVGCSKDLIVKIEGDVRRPSKQMADLLGRALQIASPEHDLFVRAARAELAPDRLPNPTLSVPQPTLSVPTRTATTASTLSILPSGTVTFLFTDIAGSTRRWEEQPDAMRQALARHDALLRETIATHHGQLFKTMGDACCAAFAAAPDALAAAVAGQRALAAQDWGSIGALRVRMAVHTGTAVPQAGDYLGQPLNRVARLLSASHGGQIVLSLATHELVRDHLPDGASLRDLGSHRLKDLVRPEPIFQLCTADLPTDFPALKSLDVRTTNLPVQVNGLIGRTHAVAQVRELVGRTRLVTLTGPGGMGKTRLALHVGAELLDQYPDGVWFIDLAPLSDPDQLAVAMAQALGIPEASDRPIRERVFSWLQQRQILLLLDNCEQVIDGVARLVAEVLGSTTHVQILATSRIPLRIAAEQEYPVLPLDLPNPQALPPFDHLSQYDAVALFIARARAIRPDFMITNANAPAVAEICVRLDGLPLAIELAAARIRLFSPEQLLSRLISAHMQTLTGGARDLPARQQTIRATIDWSYRLLTPPQQRLFMRLGVFVGGWTLEAAEAVVGEAGLDVAEGLHVLVEHSLVRMVDADTGIRTTMLETIREFALEQLRSLESAATIHHRHAAFFVALAAQLEPRLWTDQQHWAFDRLYQDVDNLRSALTYTTGVASSDDHTRIALSLATSLQLFWRERTTLAEGLRWIKDALSAAHERLPALRARALYVYGEMAGWRGLIDEAEQALQTGLAVSTQADVPETTARILHALSELCYYRGNVHQGLSYAIDGFRVAEQVGDSDACGWTMLDCARMQYFHGDLQQARSNVQSAMRFFEQAKDAHGTYFSRVLMAEMLLDCGDTLLIDDVFRAMRDVEHAEIALVEAIGWRVAGEFEQARRYFEHKLTNVPAEDDPLGHAMVSYELGATLLLQGDLSKAHTILYQALPSVERIANRWIAAMFHHALGITDIGCKYITEAQAHLTTSLQIYRAMSPGTRAVDLGLAATLDGIAAVTATEALQHEIIVARAIQAVRWWGLATQVRSGHQPGFFSSPCVAPLPINLEIIEHSQGLVRAILGDEAFNAAWADGQALTLDEAIAEALAFTASPAATP